MAEPATALPVSDVPVPAAKPWEKPWSAPVDAAEPVANAAKPWERYATGSLRPWERKWAAPVLDDAKAETLPQPGVIDKIGQPLTEQSQLENMANAQGSGVIDGAKNIAKGMGERVIDLFAGFGDLVATTAPSDEDGVVRALPSFMYSDKGTPEQSNAPTKTELQTAAQTMHDTSLGYKPGTTWEDVKKSPAANFIPFAIEQGLVSAPDMAAAMAALPAYIAARTGELADERASNNAAQNATVEDLLVAMPAATASALLDRIGGRAMFGLDDVAVQSLKQVPKEVAKATLKEGLTEGAQEGIESVATTAGTQKGFDPMQTGEQMLAGSLAGGVTGGMVRAGTGTLETTVPQNTPVEGDQSATVEAEEPSPLQSPVTQDGGEEVASPLPSSLPSITPEERAILRRTAMPDEDIDAMSPEERQAKVAEAIAAGVKVNGAMVRAAEQYAAPQPAPENIPVPEARPDMVAPQETVPLPTQQPVERVEQVPAPVVAQEHARSPVAQPQADLSPEIQQQIADTVRQSVEADKAQQVEQAIQPVIPQIAQTVQQNVENETSQELDPEIENVKRSYGSLADPINVAQMASENEEAAYDAITEYRIAVKAVERRLKKKYGAKTIGDLDDAPLTNQERNFLFYDDLPDDNDLMTIRDPVGNLSEAVQQLDYALRKLPDQAEYDQMTSTEKVSTARVMFLAGQIEKLGGDVKSVLKEAVGRYASRITDPNDQEFLTRNMLERIGRFMDVGTEERPQRVTEEAGPDNRSQLVIPGAERASDADMAQRKADAPLKPKVAQKDAGGLFSDDVNEPQLFDKPDDAKPRRTYKSEDGKQRDMGLLTEVVQRVAGVDPKFADTLNLSKDGSKLWGRDASKARGQYNATDDVITLALDLMNWDAANHEAFHRIQNLFLTDKERAALKSDERRLRQFLVDSGEKQASVSKMARVEVEAEAFAKWVAKKDQPAKINTVLRRAWDRMADMFRKVRNLLTGRGFQTYEDIFKSADEGSIKERAPLEKGTLAAKEDVKLYSIDQAGHFRQNNGMNINLNSIPEIKGLLRKHDKVFVRWSAGPKFDLASGARSKDYQSGEYHDGLSAIEIDSDSEASEIIRAIRDYSYLRGDGYKNNAPHLYTGTVVGKDSDGAPSIRPDKYLGTLSDDFVAFIDDDSNLERLSLDVQIERAKGVLARQKELPKKFVLSYEKELSDLENMLEDLGGPLKGPIVDDSVLYSIVERAPDEPIKPRPSVPTIPKPKNRFSDRMGIASKALAAKIKSKGGRFDRLTEGDEETLADLTTRKVLDYLDPVLKMQEKVGGNLNDYADAYLTARLAEGTIRHELHVADEKYVQPAIKELAQVGATEEDLHRYMYAMHAPERNRVVGLRNEEGSDLYKAATDPSIRGASGMSTNEAREILSELAKDRQKLIGVRRAASHIRAMLDDGLKTQLKAGLINKATYERLTQQWQHYVPLRAESDQDGTAGGAMPKKSRGFDVRGDEFKGATGRYTKADNVVTYAINNAEQSIGRAEKNKAATAALRFINQFDPQGQSIAKVYWSEDPDKLGDITKAPPVYKRTLDKDGKVTNVKVNAFQMKDDVLAAKVGGKTYYMQFADPKVGIALKKMTFGELGAGFQLIRKVSNWQSIVNTRANPAFVPINMLRDIQTGATIALSKDFKAGEIASMVGNIPRAWGALWRDARGKAGDGKWDKIVSDFKANGGKILFDQYNTVEETAKKLQKELRRETARGSVSSAIRAWSGFIDLVEGLNDTIENGMRVVIYDTAIKQGKTPKRAAFLARDMTVDFQKKGEITPHMNALYTFFNASVQGNTNFAKAVYKSRKVKVAMGALIMAGYAQHIINLLAGDDDDGENAYLKMLRNAPWEFERNVVIFIPGTKEYIKFPLGFGMNAFWHLGVQGGAVTTGDKGFLDATLDSTRVAFDAFNPLGSGGWVSMALPTIVDPIWELGTNQNFSGNPIYPQENQYDPAPPPKSEQSFKKTAPIFKDVAEFMNSWSGGNKILPGAVDVYPDSLEYLWGWFTGGVGRFASQTVETAQRGVDLEFEPKKTPFVRSFYGEADDAGKRSEYFAQREKVQLVKGKVKEFREAGDTEGLKDYISDNKQDYDAQRAFEASEKMRRKINKQRRALEKRGGSSETLKRLDEQELSIMNRARKAYFEAGKPKDQTSP